MTFKLVPTFLLLLFAATAGFGQKNIKDQPENLPIVSFSYGFYTPGGDLSKRFGENSAIGVSGHYKLKSNWLFGLESNILFGRLVYEPDMLKNLQSDNGEIFDEQSRIAEVILFERGYILTANAGRLFPIKALNPNSGILVKAGIGFMQHKIRIEHQNHRIPQLEGDYIKGYDRLTNGLSFNQFIGLLNMSNSKLANFYIGLDLHEGLTKGRRDYNFDTRSSDTNSRLDMFIGFKVGWCLPIYKRMATDYYIN
jgi:hypothetical protein